MSKKKGLSWLLTGIMVLNLIPINLLADSQNPVNNLFVRGVGHINKGDVDGNIHPKVVTEWSKPIAGEDGHNATYYQFEVTESLTSGSRYLSEKVNVDVGANSFSKDIGEYYFGATDNGSLDSNAFRIGNGKVYKVGINARHTHTITRPDGSKHQVVAPNTGIQEYKHILTDFNTQLRDSNGELELVWEYVPGATYRIVYLAGDKNTKGDIDGSNSGDTPKTVRELTDSEVQDMLFKQNGETKVSYKLKDTKPGQIYSAYVEVIDIKNAKLQVPFGDVIKNKANDVNGPKIVKGIPALEIKISDVSNDLIKISWDNNSWAVLTDTLQRILVYGRAESKDEYKLLASKNNDVTSTIKSIIIDRPKETTYYYIDFIFIDSSGKEYKIQSKIEPYTLEELIEIPLKPRVPKPYGSNTKIKDAKDKKNYVVKNDDIDYRSKELKDRTFTVKTGDRNSIQLVWDAPIKSNTNNVDYSIKYDIWVTENKELLNSLTSIEPVISDLKIEEGDTASSIQTIKGRDVVGLKTSIDKYTNKFGESKPIDTNKTYYIAIVAKKEYGKIVEISDTALVSIGVDKDGDIFQPPVVGKMPLKIDSVSKDSISIAWLDNWYDIIAKNPDNFGDDRIVAAIGSSSVYLDRGNKLPIQYTDADGRERVELLDRDKLDYVISEINKIDKSLYSDNYYERYNSLGNDIGYEVKYYKHSDVVDKLDDYSLEEWIVKNDSDSTDGWSDIKAVVEKDENGKSWLKHSVSGLKPNNRYIILLRAYRYIDGVKIAQTFPSYIMGTTENDFKPTEPTPVVPNLSLEGKTDTSLSVSWKYNYDFDYELVYSRKDAVEQAKSVTIDISTVVGSDNYVADGGKAVVDIRGLFPDTYYNVWLRVKQKSGGLISDWSSPLRVKTGEFLAPPKPKGFGVVSKQTLIDLGINQEPISDEYITVEWLRDIDDIDGLHEDGSLKKEYSYIVEFADNEEILDSLIVDTNEFKGKDAEAIRKNIVKFNGLYANKPYYMRVKSRITIKDTEAKLERSKESEFTDILRVITKTSENEYDGGDNDNIIVFDKDIEETYNSGVWTIEILNTSKVLSDILKSDEYYYTVDMGLYSGKIDANVRRVIIPKPILEALDNNKMCLRIVTNNSKYDIEMKSIKEFNSKVSIKDKVEFNLENIIAYDIRDILNTSQYSFISGEKLSIKDTKGNSVTQFDSPIKVSNKVKEFNGNTCYTYTNTWNKLKSTDTIYSGNKYKEYNTLDVGIYSIFKEYLANSNDLTTKNMEIIKKTYGVGELGNRYSKYSKVHANQYVNLLLGIANNSEKIVISGEVNKDKASKSGIYTDKVYDYITVEQALHGLVRLHEIVNGYSLPDTKKIDSSGVYKQSVNKAYTFGLIDSKVSLTGNISVANLCDWLYELGF